MEIIHEKQQAECVFFKINMLANSLKSKQYTIMTFVREKKDKQKNVNDLLAC